MKTFLKNATFLLIPAVVLSGLLFFSTHQAIGQTPSCDFTRNLTVGARGGDVNCLQRFLISEGVLRGNPTRYFGPITESAVADWQRAENISPSAGYFGPISIARYRTISGQSAPPEPVSSATQNTNTANRSEESSAVAREADQDRSRTLMLQTKKNLLQKLASLYKQMRARNTGNSTDNLADSSDEFNSLSVFDTDGTEAENEEDTEDNDEADDDSRDSGDRSVLSPRDGGSSGGGGGGGSSDDDDDDDTDSSVDDSDNEEVQDTRPPQISSMQTTANSSGATLSWTTDEPTRSTIAFGPTASYGETLTDDSYDTQHTMMVDNLASDQTYHYQVTVTDAAGNEVTTEDRTFVTDTTPDTTAPSITLTAPTDGATVSGSSVQLAADASDDRGISGVSFFVDGSQVGGEDGASPYSASWNSEDLANGSYSLSARARDTAGNTQNADPISVTVDNTNEPPTISFTTAPEQNETVAKDTDVDLVADAADPDGSITNVRFSVDDQTIKNDSSAPYSATWRTGESREYTLRATATDNEGAEATTDPISVRVNSTPQASFSATPENGNAPLAVSFDAQTSDDPDGDSLSYAWDFGNGASGSGETTNYTYNTPGSYSVVLTVTDPSGASDASTQSITALDGTAPAAPTNLSATADSSDQISLSWSLSSDDSDDLAQYVIYSDTQSNPTTVVGAVPDGTGSFTHSNLSAETTYHYRVTAEDGDNNESGYSSEVSATTDPAPDTTAPTISSISVSRNTNSAAVSWGTNEPATSRVNYGKTTSYGDSVGSGGVRTSHGLTILGLDADTTYHYELVSSDAAGNTARSGDRTFRTKDSAPQTGVRPTLLLGGSKDDNLFQISNLTSHLDEIVAAGGNYVRNVMSGRDSGDEQAFREVSSGTYDLNQWNSSYWNKFDTFLQETAERDIVVQLELWDQHDHTEDMWQFSPWNPNNNNTYSTSNTTLEGTGAYTNVNHDNNNQHDLFLTVPALNNDQTVLSIQENFVDKVLSYTLDYDHVLYIVTNELFNQHPVDWSEYWINYVNNQAGNAGEDVIISEMFQEPYIDNQPHLTAFNNPQTFDYIDISQNASRGGQSHWDQLQWAYNETGDEASPRPLNHDKIYGGDDVSWSGGDKQGVERFWRNIIGGAASARFHRPPTGIGLDAKATAQLTSARMMLDEFNIFEAVPDSNHSLLGSRSSNEAYLSYNAGKQYAVYFPNSGSVTLDLSAASGQGTLRWLDIDGTSWGSAQTVSGGGTINLTVPGSDNYVATVIFEDVTSPDGSDAVGVQKYSENSRFWQYPAGGSVQGVQTTSLQTVLNRLRQQVRGLLELFK